MLSGTPFPGPFLDPGRVPQADFQYTLLFNESHFKLKTTGYENKKNYTFYVDLKHCHTE